MLVLMRRRGERIQIGDQIDVVVLAIERDRVRLGFSAPGDVTIHREELFLRIGSTRPEPLYKA